MPGKMLEPARQGPIVDGGGILPPRAFAIHRREAAAGVLVLALEGEFDLAATAPLRRRVAGRPAGADVVLDLRAVTFMDCSLLKELLRADAELRAAGRRLWLAATPPGVRRLLALTGAAAALTRADTVAEALARIRA
jgi:anti-sigma B factor antagonist